MKIISGIAFLFIFSSFSGYYQETYSRQNLGQASQKDLDLYFGKAVKLKKAGLILTIAGPASLVTGTVIAGYSSMGGTGGTYKFGLAMVFAGIGATAAGIPILITGLTRIKKVREAKAASKGIASMYLIPKTLFNYETQNFQPGIKLIIRF
jgi:hypothetical protein